MCEAGRKSFFAPLTNSPGLLFLWFGDIRLLESHKTRGWLGFGSEMWHTMVNDYRRGDGLRTCRAVEDAELEISDCCRSSHRAPELKWETTLVCVELTPVRSTGTGLEFVPAGFSPVFLRFMKWSMSFCTSHCSSDFLTSSYSCTTGKTVGLLRFSAAAGPEGYPPRRRSHTAGTDGWGASRRRSSGRRCAPSPSFHTPLERTKAVGSFLRVFLPLSLFAFI